MLRREFLYRSAGAVAFLGLPRPVTEMLGGFGRPRPTPVVSAPQLDAHMHVQTAAVADRVERSQGRRILEPIGSDDLVRRLDASGIQRGLVFSGAYLMASDLLGPTGDEQALVQAENDYAATEVARHPDRLTGFLSINPKREYAIEEIDRGVEIGLRGVKIHLWNSEVNTRDAAALAPVRRTFEHITARGLPVTVHAYNGSLPGYGPDDFEAFLRELVIPFPSLRVCFAHLTGGGGSSLEVPALWRRLMSVLPDGTDRRRVFLDLSAVLWARPHEQYSASTDRHRQTIGSLLEEWGVEQALWGSDNIAEYLSLFRDAWPLSDQDWERLAANSGAAFLDG